jgi:hypothetical protein
MAAKTRTIIKTKDKTKAAKVSTRLSNEQLRRAALTGKCHPSARQELRALLEHANEFAFESVARELGTKAGDVRVNLKRAVGLLRDEAAYGYGGAPAYTA